MNPVMLPTWRPARWPHKQICAAAGLAIAALISGCALQSSSAPPKADDPLATTAVVTAIPFDIPCPRSNEMSSTKSTAQLPDTTFDCLSNGEPISLAQFVGRPTIIHIWASWCQVCREDMPTVLAAQVQLPRGIQFIGVDWKDDLSSARGYATAAKLTFPSIVDPQGRVAALWGVNVQPATVFIRADGTVAHVHVGSFKSPSALVDTAQEYLQ